MSATNANPTGEVGNERENNQGVDFDSSHIAEKQDLDFKSGDIEKKEGKDYFVNIDQKEVHRIEQRKAHKEAVRARKKFLRDNNGKIKKYSIIFISLAALCLVGVVIAAIVIVNQKSETPISQETMEKIAKDAEESDKVRANAEAFGEIKKQYAVDTRDGRNYDMAYERATKAARELLEKAPDDEKITIVAEYSGFLTTTIKKPEEANALLAEYEKYATTDELKMKIYTCYIQNYTALKNFDKVSEYIKLTEGLNVESYIYED